MKRRVGETDDACESQPVTVRLTYEGQKFALPLDAHDDVSALADTIRACTGVERCRQKLICRGKVIDFAEQGELPLEALLPRPGASEMSVMLLTKESQTDRVK